MSSALFFSAIPFVMNMLGDRFDMADVRATILQARKEKRAIQMPFCSFDWDSQIQRTVGADCGTYIYVRDVVELPEFRARLGNVLSKRGKHKCTVLPFIRDRKVLKDEDVVYDDALVLVIFEPWNDTHTVTPGACILRGNKSDKEHVRDKRGVCWYCGGFEG